MDDGNAGRVRLAGWSRNQGRLAAPCGQGAGNGVALLAGRAVADEAYRVNGLEGGPLVTSARRPASGRSLYRKASSAAAISSGSLMRPMPYSPQAMLP